MKLVFTCILVFFIGSVSIAQNGIIYGNVNNNLNNEPMPFVTVIISGTNIGTITDEAGYYKFETLQPGLYNLEFSFIGYKKKNIFEIQVTNAKPFILNVTLEEDISQLDIVEIKATSTDKTEESPLSLRTIGANEIQRNPGGNRDISKVIQSLPGVTYTASFRNDIIIRGGAPNENRFYLDGIEVPNINHFATQGSSGGPVGMINVDFIREVEFYSGAFPVNYGNALSSVLSFEQRDGRTDKWGGTFTVGSSDVGITAEGPVGERSSVLFSARRSYLQFLFDAIGLPFLPTYNDFQFKQKIKINTKNELTIIGLGAIDQFELNLEDDTSAFQQYILGNLPVQSQWNYVIGGVYKHFRENGYSTIVASRNMLNNRAYKYLNNDESFESNLIFDYTSREIENKFRYEETTNFKGWRLKAGVNYEFAKYSNDTYQLIPIDTSVITIDYLSSLNINKWGVFLQTSKSIFNSRLTLSLGIRADANDYSDEMNNLLQQISPRLSASYKLTDKWSLNFNSGIYYQLPAYTVLGYAEGENNFVNKTNNITYIKCDHLVGGVEYRPNNGLRFTLESFYKGYSGYPFSIRDSVALANLGADFGVIGDEEVTSIGKGRSYGIEFFAQQKLFKNFYGILALTYVTSEFEDKTGTLAPSSWDNKTIISLTAGKKFKGNWEAGIKWRFSGGLPYTPYDADYSSLIYVWDLNQQGVLNFEELNTKRLDPFHQLDIRIDKKWFLQNWNLDVYVDIQNIYNHKTELQPYIVVVKDEDGNAIVDPEEPSRYKVTNLENVSGTILPSIGIIIEI